MECSDSEIDLDFDCDPFTFVHFGAGEDYKCLSPEERIEYRKLFNRRFNDRKAEIEHIISEAPRSSMAKLITAFYFFGAILTFSFFLLYGALYGVLCGFICFNTAIGLSALARISHLEYIDMKHTLNLVKLEYCVWTIRSQIMDRLRQQET